MQSMIISFLNEGHNLYVHNFVLTWISMWSSGFCYDTERTVFIYY